MQTIERRKEVLQDGQRVQLYVPRRDWSKDGAPTEYKATYKAYYLASYDGFQKRKNSRRFMYPSNFSHFEVIDQPKAKSWASKWGCVAKAMKNTGVNLSNATMIERNIKAGQEAMQDLAKRMATYNDNEYYPEAMSYDERQAKREQLLNEWADERVELGYTHENVYNHLTLGTQNYPMQDLPRIVKVNIRKEYVEQALENVKNDKAETDRVQNWQSPSRDYSVSVHKHTGESCALFTRGEVRAYYASEYKNCGNGAYYMLMSSTQAWHMEND